MNQKQMQYFVTVYETQNIQVAADQLFVTRQGQQSDPFTGNRTRSGTFHP